MPLNPSFQNRLFITPIQYLVVLTIVVFSVTPSFAQENPNSSFDSILTHIGEIQTAHPDSALKLIASIKPKAKSKNDQFALMKIATFEGLDYYYKSEYKQASEKFFEALDIAESTGEKIQEGILRNNLGSVYFDLKQYSKAHEYYKSAYVIMNKANNVKWLSKITGNYAGVFFMQGDLERAIELLNESIEYGLEAETFVSVAGAYGNLAMVLTQLNRKEEALATFDKGLQMLESVGDKRGVCIVMQKLGELLSDLGENQKAEEVLRKTLKLAHHINHKESIMNAHLTFSSHFESLNQQDSAMFHLKKHIQWKDSVFDERSFETINELEQKYQSAKKQAAIEKLEVEKQRETAQREAKELENWLLWLGIGISIVILGFIFVQLLNKRKSNLLLSEKNMIIEANLAEKEVLMREIHHRVKNNFQLVSGVLMIQASNSKDDGIKEALMDVRNRIQSMATTHQKLYQSNSISEINLRTFLTELAEEVELGYGEEDVELKLDVANTSIPVELAVTTGLIVTEAMINAYKYAFENEGTLIVKAEVSGSLTIEVKDDGIGFDVEQSTHSFGMSMIKSLVQKASGEVIWKRENGTIFKAKLPLS